ncbi:anthranilate synthase component I family protein [Pedobacter sp. MW01-1-1]|uniref:anthranilate synthase component I family protein n=1 Tax=Pedobacter sp. MW01-1-1 TaxID=3383027 RepID=UPI003FF112E1
MKTSAHILKFKDKALHWANQFDVCCLLDSNGYKETYSAYDFLLAADVEAKIQSTPHQDSFQKLKDFYTENPEWMFGFFSYDLKNEIEPLFSNNQDNLHFPELFFFIPKFLIACKNDEITVLKGDKDILKEIENFAIAAEGNQKKVEIKSRLSKEKYIQTVENLQEHIKKGNIYEVNFCQEFFAEQTTINPIETYKALNRVSPTPFGGYFKQGQHYILSATPERFLCKRNQQLISQPIKGTAKRSQDFQKDEEIKRELKNSLKEQTENVMIVDLVRHDLTKSAVKGSVRVDELFGIYTFPQVHQMISTISCTLAPEVHFIDAIKNAFPMGSMTGAPKYKAMELIEQYEATKRSLYSGSFGCVSPDGDFDFNVIIRSILYNAAQHYLSFQVGGAITYHSQPQLEYEECLLKASAILQILS